MGFEFCFTKDKSHIGKGALFEELYHIFGEGGVRDLNTDGEYPDIVKTKFTVVSSKDIELSFDNICCMATSRTRFITTSLNFIPSILFYVENMDIIHPLNSIVPTEIVNF